MNIISPSSSKPLPAPPSLECPPWSAPLGCRGRSGRRACTVDLQGHQAFACSRLLAALRVVCSPSGEDDGDKEEEEDGDGNEADMKMRICICICLCICVNIHLTLVNLPRPLETVLADCDHLPQLLVLPHPCDKAFGEPACLLREIMEVTESFEKNKNGLRVPWRRLQSILCRSSAQWSWWSCSSKQTACLLSTRRIWKIVPWLSVS